jgi:hypothetical protein
VHVVRLRAARRIGHRKPIGKNKIIVCARRSISLGSEPAARSCVHIHWRSIPKLQLYLLHRGRPQPKPHTPTLKQLRTVLHRMQANMKLQDAKVFCFFSSEKKKALLF